MRKLNAVYGIIERLNDIIGNDESGDFSNWSLQGVSNENLKRLVQSIVGQNGTVGYGLTVTGSGTVSAGVGLTPNGDILYHPGGSGGTFTSNDGDKLYLNSDEKSYGNPFGRTSETTGHINYNVGSAVDVIIDSTDDMSVFKNTATVSGDAVLLGEWVSGAFTPATNGWTGTFTDKNDKIVTVSNGLITGVA